MDGVVHVQGMLLHLPQQFQVFRAVQEHSLYNFRQDTLGRTGQSRVVQQVALAVFAVRKQVFGQPAYQRSLFPAAFRLQQLDTRQDASVLVLPAATGGKQLFQYQGAVAYLLFVPSQSAEIIYGSQHGSRQNRTGSQTGTRRNGGEQGHLQSAAESLQLFLQ